MLSLFSLVLVLAVAPLSLAVSPLQQRDAAAPFVEPDADSVLEVLARDAQAARGSCYVTGNRKSRPNSCSAATCVPREHCRPSSKGRCAFREPKRAKRPVGCRACRCARYKGT